MATRAFKWCLVELGGCGKKQILFFPRNEKCRRNPLRKNYQCINCNKRYNNKELEIRKKYVTKAVRGIK